MSRVTHQRKQGKSAPKAKGAGRRASPRAWLDERLVWSRFRYPIPRHANRITYTLGGITFLSFLVLVVSGIYLALFYRPIPAKAHQSVATIVEGTRWGAALRGIHSWTSGIFVAGLALST